MTRRCGIVLHPAGHTLSPVLHRCAYEALALDATYEVFDVPPEALPARLRELRGQRELTQLSVSLPHKETALELSDVVTPHARAIGATNTLTWREADNTAHGRLEADNTAHGRLEADNTDWVGVVRSLEPHGDWAGARATVVGAGGAARASVYALRALGCEVTIVNRTRARAERLARDLGGQVGTLDDPYDLLLNTTRVGMAPESEETPVPASQLRPGALVFDAVYAPLQTRLLREAESRGCRVQDGLDMLVHQAVEQIRIWSDRTADAGALRRAALDALASR